MNTRRIFALARRVIRQIVHDRRTLALLFVAPPVMLGLAAILFRAEQAPVPLGLVNEDEGLGVPGARIAMGDRIAAELESGGVFEVMPLERAEIEDRLRDGTVQGVVVFPADFSARFHQTRQSAIDLRLEGSNPTRSQLIAGRVTEAAMRALAGLVSTGVGLFGAAGTPGAGEVAGQLPVTLDTSYLYAGEAFDAMDYIAPVYIPFLGMFFVFLLTCVSFLRERSQGTMERLLATPASRLEILLGYLGGLGLFAVLQVAVILLFTLWAIQIHYLGNLALLLVVIFLLALVGVSMGILASTFARTEFQVIQFIPLVIIPQALLSGTFWAVEELPTYLQPVAYLMPLTYANRALRDIMLKGWGLAEIWPNMLILAGFVTVLVALGALTMRREVG